MADQGSATTKLGIKISMGEDTHPVRELMGWEKSITEDQ